MPMGECFSMNQKGAVLVAVVMGLCILTVAGAALFNFTATSTLGELFANRQQRAYYLAESGGRYAIPQVRSDFAKAVTDLHGKTFVFSNADKFALSITSSPADNSTLLESVGIVHEGDWLESRVRITYKIPKTLRFEYGLFSGTKNVVLEDRAYVDSYSSFSGPWSLPTRRQNGRVGTNRTGPMSIDLRGTNTIYGNALVGVGGNPSKDIRVGKNAKITGSTGTLAVSREMTPWTMPPGGGAAVDLLLDQNDTQTLPDGIQRLQKLVVRDDARLVISGNVTLYVQDSILIAGRGEISIQPGASLTIYAARNLSVSQDGKLNSTGKPENLILLGTASFSSIDFTDRAIVRAAMYAPSARTQMQKNADVSGSVIAEDITLKDDARLHYDEALGRSGGVPVGTPLVQYF